MTKDEKKLQEEERRREKEIKQFLIALSPLLLSVSDIPTYIRAKNLVGVRVDLFAAGFKQELADSVLNELTRIAPNMTTLERGAYLRKFFNKTYAIKGTTKKITLDHIILRRSEQFKDSIFQTYTQKYGFNEISGGQLKKVINESYRKNKSNFTRIQVTELHNAQIDANEIRGNYLKEQGLLLGYQYTTAGDDRVRSSHRANAGFWSLDRVKKEGFPDTLHDINCRCSFIPVMK